MHEQLINTRRTGKVAMAATAATNAPQNNAVDGQRTEDREYTNDVPLMPFHSASITAAKPVDCNSVLHPIE